MAQQSLDPQGSLRPSQGSPYQGSLGEVGGHAGSSASGESPPTEGNIPRSGNPRSPNTVGQWGNFSQGVLSNASYPTSALTSFTKAIKVEPFVEAYVGVEFPLWKKNLYPKSNRIPLEDCKKAIETQTRTPNQETESPGQDPPPEGTGGLQ